MANDLLWHQVDVTQARNMTEGQLHVIEDHFSLFEDALRFIEIVLFV